MKGGDELLALVRDNCVWEAVVALHVAEEHLGDVYSLYLSTRDQVLVFS
jgi:hypothetical protein